MNFLALTFLFYFSSTWIIQGLQHPFLTPAHAIIMVAIGFFIGLQNGFYKYLIAFVITVILGMFCNRLITTEIPLETILLALALVIGLLLALRLTLSDKLMLPVGILLSLFAGFLLGFDSSPIPIPGLGSSSILNWHFGALISIIGSVLLASLLAMVLNRFWQGIVIRVLGSWIATIAVITLALQLSKI